MYYRIMDSFIGNIKALRNYVDSVEPIIKQTEKEKVKENIIGIFVKNFLIHKLDENKLQEDIPEPIQEIYNKFDEIMDIKKIEDKDKDKKILKVDNNYIMKIANDQIKDVQCFYQEKSILYRGSLVSLIIYFEGMISKLFKTDFINHPERMSLDKKTITYESLMSLNSFEEVKNKLIEEEIINKMYKGAEEWFKYFKTNLKIKLSYIDSVKDELNEIFARRNLFVHNDGKVNSVYLEKVSNKFKSKVKRGDLLEVDREYVDNAIDLIEEVGVALILEVWINEKGKLKQERKRMFDIITNEYLNNERWSISLQLYSIFLTNKKNDKKQELMSKLNLWQCYKWLGRYNEVEKEIEKEDFSACSVEYQLGLLALEEKIDDFFKLFDEQDRIKEFELKKWPIFKAVRESDEYKRRFNETLQLQEII